MALLTEIHSAFITLFLSCYTIYYFCNSVASLHQIAFCPNLSASNQRRVEGTQCSLISVDLQQPEQWRLPCYLIWHNSYLGGKQGTTNAVETMESQSTTQKQLELLLFRKSPREKKIQSRCFRLFLEHSDLTDASKSVLWSEYNT